MYSTIQKSRVLREKGVGGGDLQVKKKICANSVCNLSLLFTLFSEEARKDIISRYFTQAIFDRVTYSKL